MGVCIQSKHNQVVWPIATDSLVAFVPIQVGLNGDKREEDSSVSHGRPSPPLKNPIEKINCPPLY